MKGRGLSKQVISRVTSAPNGATLIITLRITSLLSPLPLQVSGMSERKSRASLFRGVYTLR